MANGMKKKKTTAVKSDDWDNFTGGGSSFPNFFGDNFDMK